MGNISKGKAATPFAHRKTSQKQLLKLSIMYFVLILMIIISRFRGSQDYMRASLMCVQHDVATSQDTITFLSILSVILSYTKTTLKKILISQRLLFLRMNIFPGNIFFSGQLTITCYQKSLFFMQNSLTWEPYMEFSCDKKFRPPKTSQRGSNFELFYPKKVNALTTATDRQRLYYTG